MLSWNVENVKDYSEKYPDMLEDTNNPQWNGKTMNVVYAHVQVGMSGITDENWQEWVLRNRIACKASRFRVHPIAIGDVIGHIGITVNVANELFHEWFSRSVAQNLIEVAVREIEEVYPGYSVEFPNIPNYINARVLQGIYMMINPKVFTELDSYARQDAVEYWMGELETIMENYNVPIPVLGANDE